MLGNEVRKPDKNQQGCQPGRTPQVIRKQPYRTFQKKSLEYFGQKIEFSSLFCLKESGNNSCNLYIYYNSVTLILQMINRFKTEKMITNTHSQEVLLFESASATKVTV
jgi:fucose permease